MIKPQLAGLQAMCVQKHVLRIQVCVGAKETNSYGYRTTACELLCVRLTFCERRNTHTCVSQANHTCQQPLAHSCRYCTVGGLLTVRRRLEWERERERWRWRGRARDTERTKEKGKKTLKFTRSFPAQG